jgi:hypothetical protein
MSFSLYIRVPISCLGWHYPEPEQANIAAEPKADAPAIAAGRKPLATARPLH